MAKRPRASQARTPTVTPQPTTPIATGTARLEIDTLNIATLFVNEVPSSSVHLDQPRELDFEYLRWSQTAILAHAGVRAAGGREGPPTRPGTRTLLHLGGAACALAVALLEDLPDSHHTAVEIDADLARLVREWLPLPRAPHLKIRVGDALEAMNSSQQRFDVIVRDAFSGHVTPAHLTTLAYASSVADHLAPDGIYLANCADTQPWPVLSNEICTLRAVFPEVGLIGEPRHLKSQRRGNIVLVAGRSRLPEHLARLLLADPVPARWLTGSDLDRFAARGRVISG
ncbi:fused MFS/spermidine synthase [Micrococcales bacterium 31B]|nr:fused MFS/spermidine synthase [Micrococcales bacterium 31B]